MHQDLTELKCNNCRESFVATRQYTASTQPTPVHEIARFCPYCGSTSLSLIVNESRKGPLAPFSESDLVSGASGSSTFTERDLAGTLGAESEDLVEEEEKPRRHSKH